MIDREQALDALASLEEAADALSDHDPLTLLVLSLVELRETLSGQAFPDLPEAP